MRKLTTLIITCFFAFQLSAQITVLDSVSVAAGYTNQTFYSITNGTISSISNTDWDLGFHADKREVSIIINSKNGVKLYAATSDTTKWTSVDTLGKISSALQLHNSDSNWSNGAFNRVPDGTFNYGWGTYNQFTHAVTANNIYFISYSNGTTTVWKKLIISLHSADYKYYFRYADLDGSNETSVMIDKNNYKTRNFVYYSLKSSMVLDREPDKTTYDLIFCQYEQEVPFYYPVTGVLLNIGVKAKYAYPVDKVNVNYQSYTLVKNISEIGGAWKAYNFTTMAYDMKDSTVYFVQDVQGKIWKLIFTGFSGSAAGKIYFSKTALGTNGIAAKGISTLGLYPNPANNSATLHYTSNATQAATVVVKNISGQEISREAVTVKSGLNAYTLNTQSLSNGTYILQVCSNTGIVTQKLTVQR